MTKSLPAEGRTIGYLYDASLVGNTVGYTGRTWDAETGLWEYRNRMYSPVLGRFLQRDPAGFVDGMNLYAYVRNNPLRFVDPTGLKATANEILDNLLEMGLTPNQMKDMLDMVLNSEGLMSDAERAKLQGLYDTMDEVDRRGLEMDAEAAAERAAEEEVERQRQLTDESRYEMTIYVDQPGLGCDRDTWEYYNGRFDPGHTYVELTDAATGESVVKGFYPDPYGPKVHPLSPVTIGEVMDDAGTPWDVKKTYHLTEEQYDTGMAFVRESETRSKNREITYDLSDYNCTDYALDAARAAGLDVPDTQGSWPGGRGSNPGDLGQDLLLDGGERNPKSPNPVRVYGCGGKLPRT